MPRALPTLPNLEQLKNQARDLLKAYRAGDMAAQQRVEQYLPRARTRMDGIVLAHAFMIIAREYGFTSWPRLKQHVEALLAERATRAMTATPTPATRPARSLWRQHIQQIAEQLIGFAGQGEIEQVLSAMAIPARDVDAVRAYLVEHGTYTLLVDALLAGVDHPRARIRFGVAQAMDHFADQRCAEPLRELLRDPVPRVRWAAIHSLSCDTCKLTPLTPGDDLVACLIELATTDPSIRVRRVAAYELGGACYDRRAVATLELLLAQETDQALLRGARAALRQQRRLADQSNSPMA
jgi:HEAT repeats